MSATDRSEQSEAVEQPRSPARGADPLGAPLSGNGGPPKPLVILVDASNVAYGKTSGPSQARAENLSRVLLAIQKTGVRPVALADASLRHKIDSRSALEELFNSGAIEQVPAGTSADDYLWQLWQRTRTNGTDVYIVTNDRFPTDRAREEGYEENPRVTFMLLGEEVYFQPPIERLVSDPLARATAGPAPPQRPPADTGPKGIPFEELVGATPRGAALEDGDAEDKPSAPRIEQLVGASMRVIASLTESPGGTIRRVNFAGVAHDLHEQFGGNFVAWFGLRKPKDLARLLSVRGLVTVSFEKATMYVEPTPAFDAQVQGLARFAPPPVGVPRETQPMVNSPPEAESPHPEDTAASLPEVIEIASRELGPTVEIPTLEMFLKLVTDSRPKHVFHWWSQRRIEPIGRWQLEGEFFFVFQGTTYKLSGRGYRTLSDFVDGRARGMLDSLDLQAIGGPELGEYYKGHPASQIWRSVLRSRNLDDQEYRPSEGDVYYVVRDQSHADFASFLATERAKPKPPVYV